MKGVSLYKLNANNDDSANKMAHSLVAAGGLFLWRKD